MFLSEGFTFFNFLLDFKWEEQKGIKRERKRESALSIRMLMGQVQLKTKVGMGSDLAGGRAGMGLKVVLAKGDGAGLVLKTYLPHPTNPFIYSITFCLCR